MRRLLLLSGLMILLLVSHAPAQTRKLYPVDEAGKDPSFKTFRDKLLQAARKKDKAFVLSILDPKIQLSFGGQSGVKDFKEIWKIEKPNSPFWKELITALELGGSFQTIEGHQEFIAPYISSKWPDDLDVFEYVAVIGTNTRLRSAPGLKAPVVASLSYEILKLVTAKSYSEPVRKDGFTWLKVKTGSGTQGYVADRYVRSPVDYRAYFRKVNGNWRMNVFIAGD